MDWKTAINAYKSYLLLERALSSNSIESYLRDVNKLSAFSLGSLQITNIASITIDQLRDFIKHSNTVGLSDRSQARLVSGLSLIHI